MSNGMDELRNAARELVDAMETCHVCKCSVLVESDPVHCEDCSGDCEAHSAPDCVDIYDLHLNLKRALARLSTPPKGATGP